MKRTIQSVYRRQLGLRGFLTIAASLCSIFVAQAIPASLGPGGFVFPPPPGVSPTGTLLATATSPFLSTSLNGTLISSVYSGDSTSPLSGLTFTYQIILSPNSPSAVSQLSVSRFGSFATDVSFFSGSAANVQPSFISRSSEGSGTGDVMQFHFGAPGPTESLLPGGISSLLIVQTDAHNLQVTTASIIDGVAVPNISSFAPLSVPEPGTAVLGIVGFALFAVARRKK